MEGKRGRGKPRRRLKKDIKEGMSMTVSEEGWLAQDRDDCRQHVKAATGLGTTFDTVTEDEF